MRLASLFGVVLLCACGEDGTAEPLAPVAIEIGDIFTCVVELPGEIVDGGVDGGTDVGMPDVGTPDVGTPDVGTDADAAIADAGPDAGSPDAGSPDAGAGGPDAGVGDGELDPVIVPTCWIVGGLPQRLNLGSTLSGRIFLGDPTCNVADGRLSCLGMNEHGQVGVGTENPVTILTRVPTSRPVLDLAVNRYFGEGFACAIFEGGGVSCWGYGENGQLGNGVENRNTPQIVAGIRGAYAIAAGATHVCVATRDEEAGTNGLSCWGTGERGELGNGGTIDSPTPVMVSTTGPDDAPRLESTVSLVAGTYHNCALDADGEVWCWGAGDLGQLGQGSPVDRPRPVRVSFASLVEEGEPEPTAVAIAAGGNHTCAITSAGSLVCWGANDRLQAGVGGGVNVLSPRLVLETATMVAAGRTHTCAISEGEVLCWGEGLFLGAGTEGDTATPRIVSY